jgi:hypothetical protein
MKHARYNTISNKISAMTFGKSPEVNEGLFWWKKQTINDDQWGIFHIYIILYIYYYIRLYKRFPQKWEHHFPMTGTFPPVRQAPGCTRGLAQRWHQGMTKWPTAWTLNGRFYRKNIGKHGKTMVKTRVSWRCFTWIKPFIATKSQEMLGFVRVTKFDNRHGKQWETYQTYNIGL